MARVATGKGGIVCTNGTHHGNSEAVGKLTRLAVWAEFEPGCRVLSVPGKISPIVAGADEAGACGCVSRGVAAGDPQLRGVRRRLCRADPVSILANEGLPDIPAASWRGRRRWCARPAGW